MFTKEQKKELDSLYFRYVNSSKANNPDMKITPFEELILNVDQGDQNKRDYDRKTQVRSIEELDREEQDPNHLYEIVKCVLDAFIYNAENSLEEMIQRAESSYEERYETMTPEQQKACDDYRIPYNEMRKQYPLPGEEAYDHHPESD